MSTSAVVRSEPLPPGLSSRREEASETNEAEETKEEKEGNEVEEQETEEAAPQLTEEERKKYANWPLKDIKEPHPNDVLYGRGGTSIFFNVHCIL
jgi:hypothetical protein